MTDGIQTLFCRRGVGGSGEPWHGLEYESNTLRSGFHVDPFGSHLQDGPVGQGTESGILLATAHAQAADSFIGMRPVNVLREARRLAVVIFMTTM